MTVLPIIDAIMPVVSDLIDRVFPDSEKREQARLEVYAKLQDTLAQSDIAQMQVNAEEAKSESLFKSGWRPFVGWVCGFGFAYHVLLQPLITYIYALNGVVVPLPVFDKDILEFTLYGLLGLGGLRTIEKGRGGITQGIVSKLPWSK